MFVESAVAPALSADEEMAIYQPPESTVPLNTRVSPELRDGVEDVVRLWKLLAEVRGDKVAAINTTYVVRRLLAVGVDQAFAELGGRPVGDEAWSQLEERLKRIEPKPSKSQR